MANICKYKVIVKGRKNACYAFYGSMPAYNYNNIIEESGTDENYTLRFSGDCKWSVEQYSKAWEGSFPVVLPDNPDEAMKEAQEKYCNIFVQDRSQMFNVEVLCNSAGIEDFDPAEGPEEIFEHYINGLDIYDDCPSELRFEVECEDEYEYKNEIPFEEIRDVLPIIKSIEGTAYEGRNARIENVKVGDPLILKADYHNPYYTVAIEVFNMQLETLGYLNTVYPVDDNNKYLEWLSLSQIAKHIDKLEAKVASVTPLSQRRNNAKYALMDVKLSLKEDTIEKKQIVKGTYILEGVYEVEDGVLKNYSGNKKKVIIPDGIISIGKNVFSYCSNLTSAIIPDSVTSIGDGAFRGCKNLTNITIPNSVTSIGDGAFTECKKLTNIIIPDSVTSIGNEAFSFCENLATITIPDSVTTIGESAFRFCENLTSITIPDGVTNIGDYAFCCCRNLTNITIPDSVTNIGKSVFHCCESLTSVTIPDGITSIEDNTFDDCYNLTSINIPNSVTSIGDVAFGFCKKLTSITIPNSVTNIGKSAFCYCESLTSITIPDGVTSINDKTFSSCRNLISIIIPEGVTRIGEEAFYGCKNLTSINIPVGVTAIEKSAFKDCENLTSVTIPDGVISIGAEVFYRCKNLTSITIPGSVTSIGDYAFNGCICTGPGKLIIYTTPNSAAASYAKKERIKVVEKDILVNTKTKNKASKAKTKV